MSDLKCVARGADDVANGFAKLDETLVQFMLVKFPVGSGTFKRTKWVYVHFVGPNCGLVKRGKWNAKKDSVLTALRNPPAGVEADAKGDLSFEYLITKLQKVFVSDNGTFNLAALKAEYDKRLEEEQKLMVKDDEEGENGDGAEGEPTSPIRQRKLATDLGLNTDQVLNAIQEDLSPFNWALVTADPKAPTLVQAGSGGIFELIDNLPKDKVLFGIVRMAFGSGRFRRTKRIHIHWTGDEVGAVTKGKANTFSQDVFGKIGPASAELKLNGSEDATIDTILQKAEKIFVVDNIKLPSGQTAKPISQEAYVEALLEEQRAASSFYEEPEDLPEPTSPKKTKPDGFPVDETVELIYREEGGLVWGLFQFA